MKKESIAGWPLDERNKAGRTYSWDEAHNWMKQDKANRIVHGTYWFGSADVQDMWERKDKSKPLNFVSGKSGSRWINFYPEAQKPGGILYGSNVKLGENGLSVIAIVEDIAHDIGADKIVHSFTGGVRLMERDGRVSPHLVKGLEDAFHTIGADKLVHMGTGGNRVVNPDGSFDPVGALKCIKSVAEVVTDATGATAFARAVGMIYQEMVDIAIKIAEAALEGAGKAAAEVLKLKNTIKTLQGLAENIRQLLQDVKANIKLVVPIAEGVEALLK